MKTVKQSFSLNRKLLLIFLLALFARLIFLSSVPSGFHNDEVDVGYVGKYLILHGRDPSGKVLPLAFNKFGDFRPIGLFYLSGLSQIVFGSNEFAVRLPTALFGALSVFPLFFLCSAIFKKREIGYFATFLLAILPWHIVLSRAGHEAILGYFFILWGLYFLVKFLDPPARKASEGQDIFSTAFQVKIKKPADRKLLAYSFLLFLISYLFYHGTRVVLPLILLCFVPLYRNKYVYKFAGLFVILSILIVLSPVGRGRLSQVVFYKNPGIVKKLAELPYADADNLLAARIFHNKPVVYSRELAGNYLQYFSANFLFLDGGFPERYKVVESGVIYIVLGFLALWGFVKSFGNRKMVIVILWLVVSPIPAVLTYEDVPSVTRASFMIFPLVLLGAVGFWEIVNIKSDQNLKKVISGALSLLLAAEAIFFAHQYFVHQALYKGVLRDEGAKEISKYIYSQRSNYDLIVSLHGPNLPFYFLFYNNLFEKNIKIDISNVRSDFRYDNILFARDNCPSHRADHFAGKKVLYIDEPNCDERAKREQVFSVKRKDLTEAFKAVIVNN